MMRRSVLFLFLAGVVLGLLFTGCRGIPKIENPKEPYKEELQWGKLYYTQMESAPFPHPDRMDGFSIEGMYFPYNPHYASSAVGFFVPNGFAAGGRTDLVFYFHGNKESIASAPAAFGLYRQFAESGVNALLIMPETAMNAVDNFGGKLEEPGGFARLVDDILLFLGESGIIPGGHLGNIIITGHSGAYQVIAKIIQNRDYWWQIKEIYLFDSIFGEVETFAKWVGLFRSRLAVVYTDGGRTAENTEQLGEMVSKHIFWNAVTVPDEYGSDPKELQKKILLMKSLYDHYGVQFKTDQFKRLLESSRVLRKKP